VRIPQVNLEEFFMSNKKASRETRLFDNSIKI